VGKSLEKLGDQIVENLEPQAKLFSLALVGAITERAYHYVVMPVISSV
jgi:hypothetical protein